MNTKDARYLNQNPEIVAAVEETLKNGGFWAYVTDHNEENGKHVLCVGPKDERGTWCAKYLEYDKGYIIPHWIAHKSRE